MTRPHRAPPPWLWVGMLLAIAAGLAWLLVRGPGVAPVSLLSAYGSTNGFYSASHIVPALALIGAGGALWGAIDGRSRRPALALPIAVGLPLAALAVASAHAVYPHDAQERLLLACAFAVFWFGVTAALGTEALALALAGLLALASDALAVDGLVQFGRGQPTPVGWTGAFASIIPVRITATLHNPNVLAAALLLGLGGAAALAVGAPQRAVRVAGLVSLVAPALALPLTFSRAAYLALLPLAAVTAVLLPRRARGNGLAALAAVALPVAAVAVAVPGVLFRVHTISVQGGGDTLSRFFTWRDALSIWRGHPLLGTGPGGLEVLYARHHAVGDARGTYVLIDVPGSADNDPLQWLVDTGLLGVAALAAGALLWAGLLWRRRRHLHAAVPPLAGAVVAVIAQGLLEVTAFVLTIEGLLAVTLAALAALLAGTGPARWWRFLGGAVAAAGVAIALVLPTSWPAEAAFAAGWTQLMAAQPARALPDFAQAARLDPTSERDVAAAGDAAVQAAYAASGTVRTALEGTATHDLLAALAIDPYDAITWSTAGALLQLAGHIQAAACAQQAALHNTPDAPYQAQALAQLLQAAHEPAAARQDAAYAARLFPLQLDVYREYGEQHQPYYRIVESDIRTDTQAWGASPLPRRPAYPLPPAVCAAALQGASFPGPYTRALA